MCNLYLLLVSDCFFDVHVRVTYCLCLHLRQKTRSKMKFWKLFLYVLFLIYPSVSSTILRLYICKDVDQQAYLLADLRVQCGTDTWNLYTVASTPLIVLYPVGIPLFFLFLLRTNRHALADKRIVAQLGFLYAGYTSRCWWFELVDCVHKLLVTSVMAFLPRAAQLSVSMAVVTIYLAVLLLMNPYLRRSDDIFHIICQVEILLVLQVAYVFASAPAGQPFSHTDDVVISVALIGITVLVIVGFAFQLVRIIHGWAMIEWDKYQAKKQKSEAKQAAAAAKAQRGLELELAPAAGRRGRRRGDGGDDHDEERGPHTRPSLSPSDSGSSRSSGSGSSGSGSHGEASVSSSRSSSGGSGEPSQSASSRSDRSESEAEMATASPSLGPPKPRKLAPLPSKFPTGPAFAR